MQHGQHLGLDRRIAGLHGGWRARGRLGRAQRQDALSATVKPGGLVGRLGALADRHGQTQQKNPPAGGAPR